MLLSALDLIQQIRIAAGRLADPRSETNTRYTMEDIVLGAFSVFLTQSPSFLSFQRGMQQETGRNNGASLFTMQSLPSDDQIRRVLDSVEPNLVFPVFTTCFDDLIQSGNIKEFKSELGYLIALDGTQYFSSDTISCKNCLTKTDKKTKAVTYYHSAITPVMVQPGNEHVLSLVPEYIIPQDGSEKQDCEINASKRLLVSHKKQALKDMEVTYLGDDLYAHEPFCRDVLATGHSFIFTCKPESHKTLYEWINGITQEYSEDRFDGKTHQIYTYKYASGVPLRDDKEALLANFVEITVTNRASGKKAYHNAFITNHLVTKATLPLIVDSGRARWKIENENNNTLKRQGYHLEHNFGHGKKNLSSLLATMNILAFLFHTMLELMNRKYKLLREKLGRRDTLFHAIRALMIYALFRSFESLMDFMLETPQGDDMLKVPL